MPFKFYRLSLLASIFGLQFTDIHKKKKKRKKRVEKPKTTNEYSERIIKKESLPVDPLLAITGKCNLFPLFDHKGNCPKTVSHDNENIIQTLLKLDGFAFERLLLL